MRHAFFLLGLLIILGAITPLWLLKSTAQAGSVDEMSSTALARFEDNSRCALGSHWLSTVRKPDDYGLQHPAEWLTTNGPTPRYATPQFRCVSARLHSDIPRDGFEREIPPGSYDSDDLWCGPGVSVLFKWEIFGGVAPYLVSAAGHSAASPNDSMLIPCTDIRSASGTEQWNEHGRVDIAIRVEDAFRSVSTVVLPVRILADSPTIAFEGMQITPGWYDATALAIHDGWFRGFRYERIGPFAPAAVGRYRSVSSDNWIYFNLSAALPQSDRGFHFPPIMSPLALRTIYEVQGAWMWTALFDCSYEGCRGLDTWRDWSSPGLLHWSDSQYFKTGGPSCAEAYVFGNSIAVRHSEVIPAELQSDPAYEDCTWGTHRVLTYLTSPDWPGVIWAYQFRGRKPSWEETLKPAERFIARYSGLPEHSEYVLTMQEPLPSSFRPAPRQSVVVRTGPTQDQTAMPAVDPSVVQIRVGADQIIVEWKDYGPLFRESINLYAKSGQRTYRSERGYRDGPRVGKVFASLDGHREFVLYFSLIAGEAKDDAPQYPSMCIVKEIRLPAGGSDAYFDRYFTVPPLNVGPTIVPGPIPEVRFEYRFNYHQVGGCLLGEYSFP